MNKLIETRINEVIKELNEIVGLSEPTKEETISSYDEFRVKWKRIRRQAGFTQKDMEGLLGISNVTIRNWELGVCSPRMSDVFTVLDSLGYEIKLVPKGGGNDE